jgi:3-oxoadipate enol-lactonase
MPRAPINGIELYYESHGQGPAVVFSHGRGGNHLSWWQQVAVFSREYRCITFDHRGWGITADQPNGPGPRAFSDDLKALLDYLEIDRAFLVSQSMGGITNLGFALEHPQRAAGLVLGDTTGGIGDPSVVDLLKDVRPPEDALGRALSRSFMEQHPARTFLFREIGMLNPDMPISVVSPLFRDPSGPKAADLAGFSVPTLLIVGQEDLIFPPHVMQAAQKLIPNSRLEVVPGAAHSTHFEQPEAFNRLVGEFLAQVRAQSGVAADD